MMKNWKKMIVTAAAFGSLALFAGCTTASAVSLEEAKDLVKTRVGAQNAVVIEQEVDRDDGVYELEIVLEGVSYEFEVDSRTGDVREVDREALGPTEAASDTITLEEAKTIAYAHAGVSESEALDKSYERDDGVFEIDFEHGGWEYDYEIGPDGTVLKAEKEPEPTAPTQPKPTETKPVETKPQTSRISLEEAKAIAYTHAGVSESEATDKSYEQDDGKYEIDFDFGGYEYEYDISYEGKILSSHKEKEHDRYHGSHHTSAPAETKPAETQPTRISGQEALSIAMNHAGVTEARDKDAEWDDGRWEVSFESGRTEYEYHISVEGKVLRWEKDQDD